MNYDQAKRQVLDDLHLKDLLEHLRKELAKQPKPTIGELIQILSEKIVECASAKHRASMQTDFEFEKIDIMRYFPILWVILIEDYPEQCISEYALFEDEQIQECHKLLKNSCRQQYISYIQNL